MTHIFTPYKRTSLDNSDILPRLVVNTIVPYALFALKTHLWSFMFEGEAPTFKTVEKDGYVWSVVIIVKAGEELIISDTRARVIESFVMEFTKNKPENMLCEVYRCDSEEEMEIAKRWTYPSFVTVVFENNRVLVNLFEVPDYSELYDVINISLYYTINQ